MSLPSEPRREPPNTYFVQDRASGVELQRLQLQDQMLTTAMGGVLPEQPTPTRFGRILDVGCGTGGWLLETASTYPTARSLVGIDISPQMIAYAREQVAASPQASRIQFRQMDALGQLDFPNHSFDLVNQRFGTSFLRKWEWPALLWEYQRVCQPGGVIRITEFGVGETSHSPALNEEIYQQALVEMQQPDFVATMSLLTVWGETPPARKPKEQPGKAP